MLRFMCFERRARQKRHFVLDNIFLLGKKAAMRVWGCHKEGIIPFRCHLNVRNCFCPLLASSLTGCENVWIFLPLPRTLYPFSVSTFIYIYIFILFCRCRRFFAWPRIWHRGSARNCLPSTRKCNSDIGHRVDRVGLSWSFPPLRKIEEPQLRRTPFAY